MKDFFNRILSPFKKDKDKLCLELERVLGIVPNSSSLYEEAFTHRSLNKVDENGVPISYERLEFLGDAVLGLTIASFLFEEAPVEDEGYLTKMRAKIVSRNHLNKLGEDLGLGKFLKSQMQENQISNNIYGNLLEALIGAIYLDKGYTECEAFIHQKVICPYVDIERLEGKVISYKSLFIEYCQKHKREFKFETFEDDGLEVEPYFAVRLHLGADIVARARATSKKKAEEAAAKRAYYKFQSEMKSLSHT